MGATHCRLFHFIYFRSGVPTLRSISTPQKLPCHFPPAYLTLPSHFPRKSYFRHICRKTHRLPITQPFVVAPEPRAQRCSEAAWRRPAERAACVHGPLPSVPVGGLLPSFQLPPPPLRGVRGGSAGRGGRVGSGRVGSEGRWTCGQPSHLLIWP